MTVALLAISDGRECHVDSVLSMHRNGYRFDQIIHVDDRDHGLGFAGAIQQGWDQVETDYVVHWECDFLLVDSFPVDSMIDLLHRRPYLAQVALKRQPVNREEIAAGGIVELHPDDFEEQTNHLCTWTEHRRFFTTNPSVYSSKLCRLGWPQEQFSEGVFTHRLLRDPLLKFAFWGGKYDAPRVVHIGERRGRGY